MNYLRRFTKKWRAEGKYLLGRARASEKFMQAEVDYIDKEKPYLKDMYRYEKLKLAISWNHVKQDVIKTFYGLWTE